MQVNKAYRPYFESDKRFNILFGGAGSGKSYAVAQKKVLKIMEYENAKEIVLRKNYVTLKESCYSLLEHVIIENGWYDLFEFKVSPLLITCKNSGGKFIFRGMKDSKDREKIKSILDPTGAWFEEANEFDKEDITQVNLRIRGDNDIPKEIDVTFNPVDEEHWLKSGLVENKNLDVYAISTTYKDNINHLDDEYIENLEKLINEDENLYNIYVLGQWGSIDKRGRIYKNFTDANILSHKYKPELPIILACDFNVDPMKWALIQNVNGIDYVFDEIVQPDTTTEEMVKALLDKYGKTTYIIYGDYSGTFRHTSAKSTDYQIIKQYLPNARLNIKPNPPVVDRINAMNWRLRNKEGKMRLFVDPQCKNLLFDLKRAKFKEGTRDEDKKLEKYDGKNPVESLIHITSALGYYIEYEYSLKGKPTVTHRF